MCMKVQPLQIKRWVVFVFMSYECSDNLVKTNEFASLVQKGFRLKSCSRDGVARSQYVCPYCKQIYKKNPFIKVRGGDFPFVCVYCNTPLYVEGVNGYYTYNHNGRPYLYSFSQAQTILVGMQKDDTDGHVVAVNGTIFERQHAVAIYGDKKKYQTYNSYVVKQRVIFHLDQNQVYFVNKDGFHHGKMQFDKWVTLPRDTSDIYQLLYKSMIETVFLKAYGFDLPFSVQNFQSLSLVQCFYLLKFPVIMMYFWQKVLYDKQWFLFACFHWSCNDDRKLRVLLTTKQQDVFCDGWQSYLEKTFCYYRDVHACMTIDGHTPLFLLLAWQMGHLGFRSIQSCMEIESVLLSCYDYDVSIPLLFLFHKRNHAICKWYRRLLIAQGEDSVVQMLIRSDFRGDYEAYAYRWRSDMLQSILSIDFENENFLRNIDTFF